MNRRLFVGNIPYSTTDRELKDMFSEVGAVVSVRVITDRATGRSRGFAFVEMATEPDAQAAVDRFHDTPCGGRKLLVNEAKEREQAAGGARRVGPSRERRPGRGDWR